MNVVWWISFSVLLWLIVVVFVCIVCVLCRCVLVVVRLVLS